MYIYESTSMLALHYQVLYCHCLMNCLNNLFNNLNNSPSSIFGTDVIRDGEHLSNDYSPSSIFGTDVIRDGEHLSDDSLTFFSIWN